MKNKEFSFTINRSKWRTGGTANEGANKTGKGVTYLLNQEGCMCCLGFFSNQLGIPKKYLMNKASPEDLSANWTIPFLLTKTGREARLVSDAITINDELFTTPEEKEKLLKKLMKAHNIKVKFTGKYNK